MKKYSKIFREGVEHEIKDLANAFFAEEFSMHIDPRCFEGGINVERLIMHAETKPAIRNRVIEILNLFIEHKNNLEKIFKTDNVYEINFDAYDSSTEVKNNRKKLFSFLKKSNFTSLLNELIKLTGDRRVVTYVP